MASPGYFLFFTMFFYLSLCILVVVDVQAHEGSTKIPHVAGSEVHKIVKEKKDAVVLIHKKNCGETCEEHISSLEEAIEEVSRMSTSIKLPFMASEDEDLLKSFHAQHSAVLVFYRKGIPILFEGMDKASAMRSDRDDERLRVMLSDMDDESLLTPEDVADWVTRVRSLVVRHLTDDTFEHDTQAASGATTGDWFVMFYRPGCLDKYLHRWETLNFRVQGTSRVLAMVNLDENKELEKRFQITRCPTFILFRGGKMYEYEIQKYDVDSLHVFVTTGYKNAKSKNVPIERSPFDLMVDYAVGFLKRHHGAKEKVAFAAVATIIAVCILIKMTKPAPKPEAKME